MALKKVSRPYETLIRHNEDGSIGAHHCTVTSVLDNGVLFGTPTIDPPIHLEAADLVEIIGQAVIDADKHNRELEASLNQMQAAGVAVSENLESTLETLRITVEANDQAELQVQQLTASLTERDSENQQLAARVAELEEIEAQLRGQIEDLVRPETPLDDEQ